MIKSGVRKNEHGEPVVTFRAVAVHDAMRWAIHMLSGQVEFCQVGAKTLRRLRQHMGAKAFDDYLAYLMGGDRDGKHFKLIRRYSIKQRGEW